MKKIYFLLFATILLIGFSSCTDNQSTLTRQEKEQLTIEVNEMVSSMIAGIKNLDIKQAYENTLDLSGDFKYIGLKGEFLDDKSFMKEVEGVFSTLDKAEFTFSKPAIRIVTPDIAIVTMTYHGAFYFPGMKMTFPDCGRTLVLQKIDGKWKIIHFHESMQESEFVQTPLND